MALSLSPRYPLSLHDALPISLEVQLARMNIRNIAIIAHVDHGKTTLVDAILKQTGVFRDNQETEERILDNHALERERGIDRKSTRLNSSHVAISYAVFCLKKK